MPLLPLQHQQREWGFHTVTLKRGLEQVCKGKSEWAFVGFSTSPNLSDTDTKDGYNLITTRIKWDDKVEYTTLTQDWGSKFIHFSKAKSIIFNLAKSNSVLLELKWHGEGKTYFIFSLTGSSAALKKIRKSCPKLKSSPKASSQKALSPKPSYPIVTPRNVIKIVTPQDKARLCPKLDCDLGQEILRLPTGTQLVVESSAKFSLPNWDVVWYQVTYKGKQGWVSEFNTDVKPEGLRYR